MHRLRRTVTVLIWPAIAWLGAACDQLDPPTEGIAASLTEPGEGGPGKVTGGGQIDILDPITDDPIGTATFGFNVTREEVTSTVASGHLNYVNHVTGVHLNCNVTEAGVTPGADKDSQGAAHFHCSPKSDAQVVMVSVVDNGEPGEADVFTIKYVDEEGKSITEGLILESGNIQVHKEQQPVEGSGGQ
jgi:hypothetical protein